MYLQWSLPALQLPYLCHGRFLLRLLVLAQAVAVVLAFSPGIADDPWYRLGVISIFVHWVALLTTFVFCFVRQLLNQLSSGKILLSCCVIFLLITLIVSYFVHSVIGWLGLANQTLTLFLLGNVIVAVVIAAIAMQFFIMHSERSIQLQAQSKAEFNALQARIQPHFLFNSLNTSAELIHIDPVAAEQALLDLSALFRAALHAGENVLLADELTLAKQYLSLEQWRLGNRMTVEWSQPENITELYVPALIVQPLLENAVRHGVENCVQPSTLHINVIQTNQSIAIIIVNPFQHHNDRPRNGIAIDNIRQRLQLHFGNNAQLTSSCNNGLFRVKLVIPLNKVKTNAYPDSRR